MLQNAAVLREILDDQLEMVCRFQADGTILFANRAYASTMGQTPESMVGRSLWDFVLADDHGNVRADMARLTPEKTEVTIENRLDTPEGPRWTLWRNHALEFDGEGHLLVAQSTGIDITERRLLEERTSLLVEELNHRVKNTLMVVQAMAHQTFRGQDIPRDPVVKFNERLSALAAAHTALSSAAWAGAPIFELVRQGTAICGPQGAVRLCGPELTIPAAPTVPLVMVLHELATNAMKYGALSVDGGCVDVLWRGIDGDRRLELQWREIGGPPVSTPVRKGFGSRLIVDAVERQMRGTAQVDYAPSGLVCTISFPLGASA
jgi:PAS domain S-box-containing protein